MLLFQQKTAETAVLNFQLLHFCLDTKHFDPRLTAGSACIDWCTYASRAGALRRSFSSMWLVGRAEYGFSRSRSSGLVSSDSGSTFRRRSWSTSEQISVSVVHRVACAWIDRGCTRPTVAPSATAVRITYAAAVGFSTHGRLFHARRSGVHAARRVPRCGVHGDVYPQSQHS